MPPSIHPVHLVTVLRQKSLTPAIVFLTSRRSCDEALQAFEHAPDSLPPARQESITAVLDELTASYPSLQDHPLRKTVTTCGVAAHHAGHLPSWKIAIEELMRRGCLDAVFATTTLAAGVDFPARTVVLTQSGVRRDQDTRQTAMKLHARRHHPPEVRARLPYLMPGRVVAFPRFRGIVLRRYRSRGQRHEMVTVLRTGGVVAESPVADIMGVIDRTFDFAPAPAFPWAAPEALSWLTQQLEDLPKHLPFLTVPPAPDEGEGELVKSLGDLFPCPTCPCRPTCAKEFKAGNMVKQEWLHHTRTVQSLRTGLWHKFQERAEILQDLGYLDAAFKLTADGEWARLIRIDFSLLITELIRAQAFKDVTPATLAGLMACIAYENDRPDSFPRITGALASLVATARRMTEALAPYDDPPLLRADVGGLAERWVGDTTVTWAQLCRTTSMAEGDIYRLLSRTLEYLSQVHSLQATHPDLATVAAEALSRIRRGVLEELP